MLYRRSPPNPPRLLLRIVATAGTSALLGAAACGGDVAGSAGNVGADAEAETQRACGVEGCGSTVLPPASNVDAESNVQCVGICGPPGGWMGGGSSSGIVSFPPGARDSGYDVSGSIKLPETDAGHDARGPCGGGPCGVIATPSDAGEAGPVDSGVVVSADAGSDVVRPCNGGPCGVILDPEGGLD